MFWTPTRRGDESRLAFRHPGEGSPLVLALDDAGEVDAPDVFALLGKADLVEGDADLGHPAVADNGGFSFPDAVPRGVVVDVVGQGFVHDRTGRIDREEVARPFVVVGIDGEHEPVRIDLGIPPPEQADDALGVGIVAVGGHIERLVVVSHPDIRLLGRGVAVLGVVLGEARGRGVLPDLFVQSAVQDDRFVGPVGLDDLLVGFRRGEVGLDAAGRRSYRQGQDDRRQSRLLHRRSPLLPVPLLSLRHHL